MPRKKGFSKKNKFDALPQDFKDAIAQSSSDEVKKRVSEIAILEITSKAVMKKDPDLLQAKQAYKDLVEPYREDLKMFKLKLEYCKQILDDKGVSTTSTSK